ncbi:MULTISPECIES: heavy metal-binding domain-containing protein [Sphingomonas]|uniref:heavy metal-binding domain-containing protein n=1 Tax=Sphingomonas TaxID=13687 RepID=UPI000AFCFA23|nr:heavy metal-binding domain-containing protein [Sphingomonas sp. CCH10-B3]
MLKRGRALLMIAALVGTASVPVLAAENPAKQYVVVNEEFGVPVFPNDITDRPYTVIGEVKAKVRKATIFSKEASQKKIYRELWERGEKLGADAVINARYGDSHVTALSWGSTTATGTAIKFNK